VRPARARGGGLDAASAGRSERARRGLLDPLARASLRGPFVVTASLLSEGDGDVLCQVELMDYEADDWIRSLRITRVCVLGDERRRR
jgi:hypothetical protein